MAALKTGKMSGVDAIGVVCPYCGEECEAPDNGSLMITENMYPRDGSPLLVTCVSCGRKCKAPAFPGARPRRPRRVTT